MKGFFQVVNQVVNKLIWGTCIVCGKDLAERKDSRSTSLCWKCYVWEITVQQNNQIIESGWKKKERADK